MRKPMTDPMSAPAWPPTEFPLPRLWERAKAMFAVIMREARSLHVLVTRPRMTWPERTSLLCRLVPVEKLVRSQRDTISGVSLDEELADLMKFQRAFQASSRVFSVIDQLLDNVVNNLGR